MKGNTALEALLLMVGNQVSLDVLTHCSGFMPDGIFGSQGQFGHPNYGSAEAWVNRTDINWWLEAIHG